MGIGEVGKFDFGSSVSSTGAAYAYDLAGRRTVVGGSYARTGTPQAASAASYKVINQLTNWNGMNLAYDANGNLTRDAFFAPRMTGGTEVSRRDKFLAYSAEVLVRQGRGGPSLRVLPPSGGRQGWALGVSCSRSRRVAGECC